MKNNFSLENKTILITGASAGIGKETAIQCSRMGASIIITGRRTEKLKSTFDLLDGSGHIMVPADLTLENDLNKFTEQVQAIDGLVHSAGITKLLPVKFSTAEKIKELFDINYMSVVLLTAALLKQKKINTNSSIVFISSVSTSIPVIGLSIYSATKAAIEAFSKTLAIEYGHMGIRSNCINPAMVKTDMYTLTEKMWTAEKMEEQSAKYPLGMIYPEDVANAAVFLLSQASGKITGTTMPIDSGVHLYK